MDRVPSKTKTEVHYKLHIGLQESKLVLTSHSLDTATCQFSYASPVLMVNCVSSGGKLAEAMATVLASPNRRVAPSRRLRPSCVSMPRSCPGQIIYLVVGIT